MGSEGVKRRLAAVLAADIAGYTRMMEADEDATMAAWWAARQDIIDPAIAQHNGRIVKHTGDGFLAEFGTAFDAVECAISMRSERNVRMKFGRWILAQRYSAWFSGSLPVSRSSTGSRLSETS